MKKLSRRQWWTVAVCVGAAILVLILALIATGVLTNPNAPGPAPVRIQEVCVNWIQDKNASGDYWFGQNNYCLTGVGNNLPYSAPAGTAVNIPVEVINYDTQNHTLYYVDVLHPFTVQRTSPPLPYAVASRVTNPEGIDGGLMVFVILPNDPGATLTVNLTVSALPGG